MRFTLACAALTACVFAAGTARAQTATGGTGSCTGMLAGTIGLSVNQDGSLQSIQAAAVPDVFGNAECECPFPAGDTNDNILLNIKLTTALPIGSVGTVEVWAGPSCDTLTQRTTGTPIPCQKVAVLDINDFTTSSTVGVNGITVPIPGNVLMSPNVSPQMCTSAALSNGLFLFIFTDPSNPTSTCTLPLTEQNQGPTSVTNVKAGPGDGAVNLTWTLPAAGSFNPISLQILCVDDCGNPVRTNPPAPQYSTCINGVLHRRTLPTGGTVATTDDGGVTGTDDLGTLSGQIPAFEPYAEPVGINCTPDGGTNPLFDNDMGTNTAGPLTDLDPKFTCSSQLGATSTSARITGLQNNSHYHFVVVAIDNFGNGTASAPVDAIPQPTEDLYRRYRDSGGAAGGCFIATAAFGSYESNWVYILRDFRDQVLLPTNLGHAFVDWYYANSPPGAAWIAERSWARAVTRTLLLPFIASAFFWVYFAAWQKALFVALLLTLMMRKRIAASIERRIGA